MRPSFAKQHGPLLVDVIKGRSIQAIRSELRNGLIGGADAFDLHLSQLDKECINTDALRPVFDMTDKPVLAVHYNEDCMMRPMYDSDEERVREMMTAVEAGAAGIDMQGYTFEPGKDTRATLASASAGKHMSFISACPNEVTLNPVTIERQTELISRVHKAGAEVLLSTHTQCPLDCGQVVDLLDFLHERKPDVIKLVTAGCDSDEQLAEYFRTLLTIKNRFNDTRIHFHCVGKMSKHTRVIGPMLGSYIAFCIDRFNESSILEQLPLSTMRTVYDLLGRI